MNQKFDDCAPLVRARECRGLTNGEYYTARVAVYRSGRAYEEITCDGLPVHAGYFNAANLGRAARDPRALAQYALSILPFDRSLANDKKTWRMNFSDE